MGNGIGKVCLCSSGTGTISCRFDSFSNDKSLGNSICYVRPDPAFSSSSNTFSDEDSSTQMTFRSISGASVSANSFTPPSVSLDDALQQTSVSDSAASFEISTCFTTMPLQPAPRGFSFCKENGFSGPMENGFFSSGPIERGFLSSPFDRRLDSSSVEKASDSVKLQSSLSHNGNGVQSKPNKTGLKKILRKSISDRISRGQKSIFVPIKRLNLITGPISNKINDNGGTHSSANESLCDDEDDNYKGSSGGGNDHSMETQNLQWAQGKAGEDRVHIVVSDENGWVFVGIYDGFNGPDATDYLLRNLFHAIFNELKELLSNENPESKFKANSSPLMEMNSLNLKEKILCSTKRNDESRMRNGMVDNFPSSLDKEKYSMRNRNLNSNSNFNRNDSEVVRKKSGGREIGWRRENLVEKKGKENAASISHSDMLRALSEALRKTEEAFLKTADEMIVKNPVLAMMGSCVLVMLMKGEDVYLMNVGDSRAVLAQTADCDLELVKNYQQLKGNKFDYLNAIQLTMDHSTQVKEEVQRIESEHPDDPYAVIKGRVKGCLNVTRAFGAGFLKQPKHNDAILETFKVDYIGNSPYISCSPSLHHHRLSPSDRFLILSSDGLYQYFTNEEAAAKVEYFIISFPDRDPAQLLIEEVLSRAAKKAGMDFHELLDIRQGDRRLYHDDISVVIISLEGKIWRSSV